MIHPFALELSDLEAIDLDFEEHLTAEEADQVGGGLIAITQAIGETGGTLPDRWVWTKALYETGYNPSPKPPIYQPSPHPSKPPFSEPPEVTTLALGEEGGDYFY